MVIVGLAGIAGPRLVRLGPTPVLAQEPVQIIPAGPFKAPSAGVASLPAPPKVLTSGLKIKISELGINLDIIEGDGINAPLYKAAHYPGSDYPGDGRRTILYAHARTGMFGPLFNAKVGQAIAIDRPDGSMVRYQITEYYARWPINDLRWLQQTDYEELVLITCTTYDPNDPRIIVVARPA